MDTIPNPVIPPEITDLAISIRASRDALKSGKSLEESVKVKPEPVKEEVKQEPVKEVKQEPVKEEKIELDDEITDPLIKSLFEEPKKPEVKEEKVETTEVVEDDVKLPEGPIKGKEAEKTVRDAFAKSRKELAAEKAKVKELEEKISKGEIEPPKEIVEKITKYETEVTELKKRLEEQEKYVQIANVEMSETFQKQIKEPREFAKQEILRIARENGGTDNGVSAVDIYKAIQTGDKKLLEQSIANLSIVDQTEIVNISKDLRSVKIAEEALRNHAKVAGEEFSKAEKAKQEQFYNTIKKNYDENLKVVNDLIKKDNPRLFEKVEGADDWNAEIDKANDFRERLGKLNPTQLSAKDVATLVANTSIVTLQKKQIDTLTNEIKRLSSRLKGKYTSQPAAGGKAGKTEAPVEKEKVPSTFEEWAAMRKSK